MTTIDGKRINVTTTAYEGDDFPEAGSYPDFVADRLASDYHASVECSTGPTTRVVLYGYEDQGNTDLEDEIKSRVRVDLWDEFCAHGYRDYPRVSCVCEGTGVVGAHAAAGDPVPFDACPNGCEPRKEIES